MGFLGIENKKFLIFGVANRKSVAFHIAKVLQEEGAELIFSVQKDDAAAVVEKFFPEASVYRCDFENESGMKAVAAEIGAAHKSIYGIVHSVAFANFFSRVAFPSA